MYTVYVWTMEETGHYIPMESFRNPEHAREYADSLRRENYYDVVVCGPDDERPL